MIKAGMFIADRYEVLEKIGTGGMSDVYRAKDHILGREVAIKVLKSEFCGDATFVAKFRSEAQSAAGLEDPNIVNIYDVGSENGMHYIVMEYIDGITLKTYIEKKGQLNYKEAISIAIQVGRGIGAAHAKSIIHRDIKPQNIIISTDGKVKVTDFGIARAATSNTIHADVMGSVHYASPEQARNGYIDGKSDIYSLGIVMYEMVTGRVPFDGESTVAIAIQHLQEEMVAPSVYAPNLPISLEKIILKATMKNPDKRYASINDLLIDLKRALSNPDEDFVIIADSSLAHTRVLSPKEQESLQREIAGMNEPEYQNNPDDGWDENGDDWDGQDDWDEENDQWDGQDEWDENGDDWDDPDGEYWDPDDDDWDGGDDVDPKMSKIFTFLSIGAGAVIVAIIVVLLGNVFGLFHFGGTKALMVNVVGLDEPTAKETLIASGFNEIEVKYSPVMDGTVPEGIVYNQSIEPGKEVSTRKTVEITVNGKEASASGSTGDSSGASQGGSSGDSNVAVTVPNLVGNKEDSAIKALTDLGLKYSREYEYSDTIVSGEVIAQSVSAGSTAKVGDTISFTVSQGNSTVTVPNVVGMTLDEATIELNGLGLNVTSTSSEYSENIPSGSVINQSVSGGKVVDAGTNITLVISKGIQGAFYSYSETITAQGDVANIIVLMDANGRELYRGIVTTTQAITINASGITTNSGTLKWLSQVDNTELGSKAVYFTQQR